jgi:hypothetical protein
MHTPHSKIVIVCGHYNCDKACKISKTNKNIQFARSLIFKGKICSVKLAPLNTIMHDVYLSKMFH